MKRLLAFVVVLAAASRAEAGNNIVLESYTGDRPADAQHLLAPVLGELEGRGYDDGDKVARLLDKVSTPATGSLPADFAAQVDKGHKAEASGKYNDALHILLPLIDQAHAAPLAVSQDPSLRQALQNALLSAAIAQGRNGDESAAHSLWVEVAVAFPDLPVTRGQWGADAVDAIAKVQQELGAKGTLVVQPTEDAATVFVDERYVGQSTSVTPGEYRVFAKVGKQMSRIHHVTVKSNDKTSLAIDVGFDAAIRATPWTGLGFATEAEREAHEGEYAAKFANAIGAKAVVVIGIEQVRGHTSVVASLFSLETGHEIRRASVPVEPDPSREKLKALASYIAGDPASQDIEVWSSLEHTTAKTTTPPPAAHHDDGDDETPVQTSSGGWGKWAAGAGGAAALVTGGVLVAINGNCATPPAVAGHPCTDLRDTLVPGLISTGVGVGLAALSVYLFVHKSESHASGTAYVSPTAGGAMLGYTRGF